MAVRKVKRITGLPQIAPIIDAEHAKNPVYEFLLTQWRALWDWRLTIDDLIDIVETGGGGGHIIQDEGTDLPQQARLNFIGAGVTATNNSGTGATDVTIPGGGGTGAPTDAQYVTMALHADLSQERVLTEGDGISITDNGPNDTVVVALDLSGLAFSWWGSGQDGVVHFNGTNTFAFANLTSGVYYLLRAVHATDCTIDNGVVVTVGLAPSIGGGEQIYCQGTFTCNGHYHCNGTTSPVNKHNGGIGGGNQSGVVAYYGVGSNGGNATGAGSAGTNGVNLANAFGGVGGVGGASVGLGGNAGTVAPSSASGSGGVNYLYSPYALITGRMPNVAPNVMTLFNGGSGGGGGGGSAGNTGGGGGGGGGMLGLIARYIAGNGIVSCDGGAGNNGDHQNVSVATAGGGGGGGGGVLMIQTTTINFASLVTARAIGGAGGTAVSPGNPGIVGSDGVVAASIVSA